MDNRLLQWHPAFYAGIQIEFEDEINKLIFEQEHNLSAKPLQIDVLIIKKNYDGEIHKNIGKIFKTYNIIEYKSPTDYLSVDDYYKVNAYAYLYKSLTSSVDEIKIYDLSITFVCRHFPRELFNHLKKVRDLNIEKIADGIYYVNRDVILTQILITSELSEKENFWLHHLTNDIKDIETIERLTAEYSKHEHNELYKSVMNVIIHANQQKFEEVKFMCEALKELFADELEIAIDTVRNEGIKCMIESSKECGGSWDKVFQLVKDKFNVDSETAEKCMKLYW
jgi:hypothetical protein